jgi:peptidoglycan/xylan/chitin deacetylase (PgdA/CDA1 family)
MHTAIRWTTVLLSLVYGVFAYVVIAPPSRPSTPTAARESTRASAKKIVIAFRNDDLSLFSDPVLEGNVLDVFRRHGIPQTFAFVPFPGRHLTPPASPVIVDSLQRWQREGAIEVALHGYEHEKSPRAAGEFDGVPYERQRRMIGEGKRFIDSVLQIDVCMFAPPWNQCDRNTLLACRDAGIRFFSGYVGADTLQGMAQVHTSAVLFAQGSGSEGYEAVPSLHDVLARARMTPDTAFIVVFYHSRTDVRRPSDLRTLDSLLGVLAADPVIEFASMSALPARYGAAYSACVDAGMELARAHMAVYEAKPYRTLMHGVLRIEAGAGPSAILDNAMVYYYSGEYAQASAEARNAVGSAKRLVALGRGAIAVVAMLLAVLWFRVGASWRRRGFVVALSCIALGLVAAVMIVRTSAERQHEMLIVGLLCAGIALLGLLFSFLSYDRS